jgi:outer membrane autotransporter protein
MALGMPAGAVSAPARTQEAGSGGWLDAYGIFGELSGSGGTNDADYTVAGTTLGFDRLFANRGVLGVALGYARTLDLGFDSLAASGEADTFYGSLYAGRSGSRSYLSVATRFAYSTSMSTRRVVVGSIDRRAEAEFDGWELGAASEAGIDWIEFLGISLQPVAFFDYVHLQTEEYTESGAGALNLRVERQNLDAFVGGLGARFHGSVSIDGGAWLAPELRVRWNHRFGDRERGVDARLPAASIGGAWSVQGASAPANEWVVGAGWSVTQGENLHVFADYDVVLHRHLTEHSFALGVRWEW